MINLLKQSGAMQNVLGHSRHRNKPDRYGTEACATNCASVLYI